MIQANDLRLGNWAYGVMYPNQPLQIKTIHENIVHLGEHINGYDSLEPIPLTPEILDNFGFKKYQWMDGYFIKTKFGDLPLFKNAKIPSQLRTVSNNVGRNQTVRTNNNYLLLLLA